MKKQIKVLFADSCICFTVISLAFILLKVILDGGFSEGSISILSFLFIYPCGLFFAASELFRKSDLRPLLRNVLNFLSVFLGCYLFLYLPSKAAKDFSVQLITILLITLLYTIYRLILTFVFKKKKS